MKREKLKASDVLNYSLNKKWQGTVRRYYLEWRKEQGLPARCDNQECLLHQPNPKWNEEPLPLILDHIDGNRRHNRTENLRLLCPNCDAQLPTRGGKNKGRIQNATTDAFHIVDRGTGRRDVYVFLTGVEAKGEVGNVGVKNESKP